MSQFIIARPGGNTPLLVADPAVMGEHKKQEFSDVNSAINAAHDLAQQGTSCVVLELVPIKTYKVRREVFVDITDGG